MSDSNITKLALANSLKGVMAKKAFSKICVSDIVGDCGLTRQAFYYHFKDKYDLMNWIYYTETARFMSSYDTVGHWTDGLKDLCNYMRQNKTFYMKALNTTGQNSFQEYLHNYIRDISVAVIENIKGTEFQEEKWGFIAEFISTAFVGMIVRWANNGMKEEPTEFIAQIRSLFDGSILYELENQSEKASAENSTELE
jgi:probable dihydroxyacetone kinase regulator